MKSRRFLLAVLSSFGLGIGAGTAHASAPTCEQIQLLASSVLQFNRLLRQTSPIDTLAIQDPNHPLLERTVQDERYTLSQERDWHLSPFRSCHKLRLSDLKDLWERCVLPAIDPASAVEMATLFPRSTFALFAVGRDGYFDRLLELADRTADARIAQGGYPPVVRQRHGALRERIEALRDFFLHQNGPGCPDPETVKELAPEAAAAARSVARMTERLRLARMRYQCEVTLDEDGNVLNASNHQILEVAATAAGAALVQGLSTGAELPTLELPIRPATGALPLRPLLMP